jgi:regulatory protein YycI of two-component signal transduction system YycFG
MEPMVSNKTKVLFVVIILLSIVIASLIIVRQSNSSLPEVTVSTVDQTPVDGGKSCAVYEKATHQLLVTYSQSSGFNAENRVDRTTTYGTSNYSHETLDRLVNIYCR